MDVSSRSGTIVLSICVYISDCIILFSGFKTVPETTAGRQFFSRKVILGSCQQGVCALFG